MLWFPLTPPEISEASLQTTILIRWGKRQRKRKRKEEEMRGEGRGKEGELGCFSVGGRLQSPSGASSVLRNSRSERPLTISGQSSWSQKEMSKGGLLLPRLLPLTPEQQHQRRAFVLFICTCLPQQDVSPTIARGFYYYYYYSLFFLSAASSVPRTAPDTDQALGEYLLNARMIS